MLKTEKDWARCYNFTYALSYLQIMGQQLHILGRSILLKMCHLLLHFFLIFRFSSFPVGTRFAWASPSYFHKVHSVFCSLILRDINPLYSLWIASINLAQFTLLQKKNPPHFFLFLIWRFKCVIFWWFLWSICEKWILVFYVPVTPFIPKDPEMLYLYVFSISDVSDFITSPSSPPTQNTIVPNWYLYFCPV